MRQPRTTTVSWLPDPSVPMCHLKVLDMSLWGAGGAEHPLPLDTKGAGTVSHWARHLSAASQHLQAGRVSAGDSAAEGPGPKGIRVGL